MRGIIFLLGVLNLGILDAGAPPRLAFDHHVQDFGTAVRGRTVGVAFVFTNAGAQPLVIEDIRSSCGCTAAALKGRTFAPGARGVVEVTLNTSRLQGPVDQKVYLITNDPDAPEVTLHILGVVS